jgi:hypothetical protein
VSFGGVSSVSFTVDSDTQIRAIVPAGAVNGNVIITTNTGSVTSLASFVVARSTLDPTGTATFMPIAPESAVGQTLVVGGNLAVTGAGI